MEPEELEVESEESEDDDFDIWADDRQCPGCGAWYCEQCNDYCSCTCLDEKLEE